ncbi:MAG: glutathione S-transferase family protein [Hyphomicrobiaceae bacterium]
MMKLLSHPFSPYARKVRLTAAMKGLLERMSVETVDANIVDNPILKSANPLRKIPVLVLDDGSRLFDSAVICEYLDTLEPTPRLFPSGGAERFKTLTLGALGDGILDAAILLVYEKRFRPEDKWVTTWTDRQQLKIDTALAHLEKNPPVWESHPDYGHIALASALGYLDFRHEGKWRAAQLRLVAWLDRFAATVPAFAETKPTA